MKVIINKCYGGFGFSPKVFKWLIENKNWKAVEVNDDTPNMHDEFRQYLKENNADCYFYNRTKYEMLRGKYYENEDRHNKRTDPDIILAVETLGEKESSSELAKLRIVEIPEGVDWEIDEYDGIESIREKSREWD